MLQFKRNEGLIKWISLTRFIFYGRDNSKSSISSLREAETTSEKNLIYIEHRDRDASTLYPTQMEYCRS